MTDPLLGDREPCPARMTSRAIPGHVHACIGGHKPGVRDHLCPTPCGRRWWVG